MKNLALSCIGAAITKQKPTENCQRRKERIRESESHKSKSYRKGESLQCLTQSRRRKQKKNKSVWPILQKGKTKAKSSDALNLAFSFLYSRRRSSPDVWPNSSQQKLAFWSFYPMFLAVHVDRSPAFGFVHLLRRGHALRRKVFWKFTPRDHFSCLPPTIHTNIEYEWNSNS